MSAKTETPCEACKEREERRAKADKHLAFVGLMFVSLGLILLLAVMGPGADDRDS
jgi:hypothetical protein